MNRFLYTAPFFIFFLLALPGSAQIGLCNQVIGSTGAAAVQGGRSYTYTVGEPFILTLSSTSYKITQGFHQPDLCVPVSTSDLDLEAWALEVYPNPATDLIHIRYSAEKKGRLQARVFDLLGHLVLDDFSIDQPDDTPINCGNWQAGVYFIELLDPQTHSSATVRVIRL